MGHNPYASWHVNTLLNAQISSSVAHLADQLVSALLQSELRTVRELDSSVLFSRSYQHVSTRSVQRSVEHVRS
jgi:hypothetical protein